MFGPDGEPLPDIEVSLGYRSPYSSHGRSPLPRTDDEGCHVFAGVNPQAPGCYTLYARPLRRYQPAQQPVTLDGRMHTFRLERGHVLQGRILDSETGWPVPGMEVRARPRDFREGDIGLYYAERETDEQGRFRFSNLAADREYQIMPWGATVAEVGPEARAKPGEDGLDIHINIPPWRNQELRPRNPEE